jgi:hypothetical protein
VEYRGRPLAASFDNLTLANGPGGVRHTGVAYLYRTSTGTGMDGCVRVNAWWLIDWSFFVWSFLRLLVVRFRFETPLYLSFITDDYVILYYIFSDTPGWVLAGVWCVFGANSCGAIRMPVTPRDKATKCSRFHRTSPRRFATIFCRRPASTNHRKQTKHSGE